MKVFTHACLAVVMTIAMPSIGAAQQAQREAELRRAVPYSVMRQEVQGLTLRDYNDAIREVAKDAIQEEFTTPLPRLVPPPSTPAPLWPSYTPSRPRSGSSYDWRSDNLYSWSRNADGTTDVNGTNLRRGTTWRTQIERDGSMNGWDGDFNPWQYDAGSGVYINYGTGQICVGEGAARVCS